MIRFKEASGNHLAEDRVHHQDIAMELEIFQGNIGSVELMEDFRNGKIHLVCVAVNALTFFNAFATGTGGISEADASRLSREVNDKNETGTLFPKLNLTIIPLSIYPGRNNMGDLAQMRIHIADCLKANEQYSRCPQLLFALEDRNDFDQVSALQTLREALEPAQLHHTRQVFYLPSILN